MSILPAWPWPWDERHEPPEEPPRLRSRFAPRRPRRVVVDPLPCTRCGADTRDLCATVLGHAGALCLGCE